jgi:hypothetical protein
MAARRKRSDVSPPVVGKMTAKNVCRFFGFAGALTRVGLPHNDLPLALLSFNVGVEIGQVSFVLLILLLERSFRQLEIRWPRWVQALPGYTVGPLGAFWTIQRTAILLGITLAFRIPSAHDLNLPIT